MLRFTYIGCLIKNISSGHVGTAAVFTILLESHSTHQYAFWRSWQPTTSSYLFRGFPLSYSEFSVGTETPRWTTSFSCMSPTLTSKFQRKSIPPKTQPSNYEIQNSAIMLNFFHLPLSHNIHFPMTALLSLPNFLPHPSPTLAEGRAGTGWNSLGMYCFLPYRVINVWALIITEAFFFLPILSCFLLFSKFFEGTKCYKCTCYLEMRNLKT
jgi:hypothetical protein